MRCFFHVSYGKMAWDSQGIELKDIAEVRSAAVELSAALLSDIDDRRLWRGTPWRLWVTEGPNGTGNTVLALSFTADYGAWDADPHAQKTHVN
jgi:uncharacterized protein DUF6894